MCFAGPPVYPASAVVLLLPAAGIYTHSPEQLEEAGKYLDEKRAAMKGVKIVTELEPTKMYYKAEVNGRGLRLLPGWFGAWVAEFADVVWCAVVCSVLLCAALSPAVPGTWRAIQSAAGPIQGLQR